MKSFLSSRKFELAHLSKVSSSYRQALTGDSLLLLDERAYIMNKLLLLVNVFIELLYLLVYDEISSLLYTRHLQ